ncbi:MAG: RNA polymerase sigma factor [Micavibrio sp.]|nr:MAG: RNA polymerase sigma factor [Micavibrio sp.]
MGRTAAAMAIETQTEAEDEDTQIRRAAGGDRAAFALLITRHYDKIYGIAWKFCGNRSDAEDVAQEAVIKIARAISSFRFEAAFTSWLYRLTVNAAKDFLRAQSRKSGREMPLKEELAATGEESGSGLELKLLLEAVDKLPDAQRDAVMLVCWEGLSHREAAEILDCAETTVSWRLYEARKKLAKFAPQNAGETK